MHSIADSAEALDLCGIIGGSVGTSGRNTALSFVNVCASFSVTTGVALLGAEEILGSSEASRAGAALRRSISRGTLSTCKASQINARLELVTIFKGKPRRAGSAVGLAACSISRGAVTTVGESSSSAVCACRHVNSKGEANGTFRTLHGSSRCGAFVAVSWAFDAQLGGTVKSILVVAFRAFHRALVIRAMLAVAGAQGTDIRVLGIAVGASVTEESVISIRCG
jgi:hypothetical protein